jgi:hypothetical protein
MGHRKTFLPVYHMLTSLLVAAVLLFTQMYVLSKPSVPWFWIDLIVVYVFYVGLEHHTFSALFKIILVSLAFELHSAVPAGFALMTHLLIMLFGNRIAVWLEMQQRTSQLVLFAFLLLIKESLFAAMLKALGQEFEWGQYFGMRLPGFFLTVLIAVPLMETLSWFDGFFESGHDNNSFMSVRSSYS